MYNSIDSTTPNTNATMELAQRLHRKIRWTCNVLLLYILVCFAGVLVILVEPDFIYLVTEKDDPKFVAYLYAILIGMFLLMAAMFFLFYRRLRDSVVALSEYIQTGSDNLLMTVVYHQYRYFWLNNVIAVSVPVLLLIATMVLFSTMSFMLSNTP